MKRFRQIALLLALSAHRADAQYTDPVGYLFYTIPGNSETLLPLQFAKEVSLQEYVTEVTPAGVRFQRTVPPNAFGSAGSGYMEVRVGAMAGLGIPATGISGSFLNLERSPVGLVSVGDYCSVRGDMTLGDLFSDPENFTLQTGVSSDLADNISIWNARTQSSQVFYYHSGLGWREAGKLGEGDKSDTPIHFPSGVILRRRAATEAIVFVTGSVIIPLEQRFHPVWPGRNIISAPFTNSPTIGHYIRPLLDAPHTVISAASAPLSDTLRIYEIENNADSGSSISPVIYFSNGQWRAVGSTQNAGSTNMSLAPCLDFQRVGPAGYIRFEAISYPASAFSALNPPQASASMTETVTEVRPITLSKSAMGINVRWSAETGKTYQVQTQPIGGRTWVNIQSPHQATSASASVDFAPVSSACIRVIQR